MVNTSHICTMVEASGHNIAHLTRGSRSAHPARPLYIAAGIRVRENCEWFEKFALKLRLNRVLKLRDYDARERDANSQNWSADTLRRAAPFSANPFAGTAIYPGQGFAGRAVP